MFSFLENRQVRRKPNNPSRALATFDLRSAIWVLTDQLAFGFRAFRLMALPIAFRFFANRFTFWSWSLAMRHAVRLFANRHTFRAIFRLASLVWAFDLAIRLLAFNVTDCISGFLARRMASWRLAHRVANCWAFGVITFPCALGMTLGFLEFDGGGQQKGEEN